MAKYTILLLLCLFGLTFAADDCAYNVYLSPNGNDTDNTGTESDTPLQTIQAGINTLVNASTSEDWDGTGNVCFNFYPGTYSGVGNTGVVFQNYTFVILYFKNDSAAQDDDPTVYFAGSTVDNTETFFTANGALEIDSRDGDDDVQLITFWNLGTAIAIGANADNNTVFISNVVFNQTKTGIYAEGATQIDNLVVGIQNSVFQTVSAPFNLVSSGNSLLDIKNTNFDLSGASTLSQVSNVSIDSVDVTNPTGGFFVGTSTGNYSVWQVEDLTTNGTSSESGSVFNIQAAGGQFSIIDSTLSFASAATSGGALYLSGIDSIIGSDDSDSDSVTFNNNTAGVSGGAIYQNGGNSAVGSATFFGNTAPYGAAIEVDGNATVTLGHVDFSSNSATDAGYGIVDCGRNTTGYGTVSLNGTDYNFEDSNTSPNITCPGDIEYGTSFSEPPIQSAGTASSHQSSGGTHWWAWLILALIIAAVIIAIIAGVAFWWFKKRQSGAYVTVE